MTEEIVHITGTSIIAKNRINGSKNTLYSYETKVAEYDKETGEMQVFGYHSLTTGKHINMFFELFGMRKQSKSELFKNFGLEY